MRGDRGQATPFVAAALVLCGVVLLLVVALGRRAGEASRAATAADAAALAGAAGGRGEAERLSQANGGELLFFETFGQDVVAWVRVGQHTAWSQARKSSP